MMITLRRLRYLDALARHRHFGRAAEHCAVTQPALSMQIQDLEQDLGVALVERRPGEIALTEAGVEIAVRAERILSAVSDLADAARQRGRLLCGPMRLGVIPSLAPYVLPRLLPVLQPRFPELRLELRETQTRSLVAELVRGSVDVAMIALPDSNPDIATTPLFDDPFLLAVPAQNSFLKRSRITADDIDPRQLILLEEGHCLRDQALAFCGLALTETRKELGATSLATVMQMVANGYGVTLVPEIAVGIEARDQRVRVLRFEEPQPYRTIGLAWRKTSPRQSDFMALGRIVIEALGLNGLEQKKGRHRKSAIADLRTSKSRASRGRLGAAR